MGMAATQEEGLGYAGADAQLLAGDGIAGGIVDHLTGGATTESLGGFVALGKAIGAIRATTDQHATGAILVELHETSGKIVN